MRQAGRKRRPVVKHKRLPSLCPAELLPESVDGFPPGEDGVLGAREGKVLGLGDVLHLSFFSFSLRGQKEVEVEFFSASSLD